MKPNSKHRRRLALAAALLLSAPFAARESHAVDLLVTTNADSGPGSFRQALADAVDGDVVVFTDTVTAPILLLSDLPDSAVDLSFRSETSTPAVIDRNGFAALSFTGGQLNLTDLNVTPGTSTGPDIDVSGTSSVFGNGTVTGNVRVGTTIAPGITSDIGSIGTINIDGDLDATNSTLQFDALAPSAGVSDQLTTTGSLNVTDATLQANLSGGGFQIADSITLIQSTGPITGTLLNAGDIFTITGSPFLEATLDTSNPNAIGLLVGDNGSAFADVLVGSNAVAAGGELDRLRLLAPPDVTTQQQTAIGDLRNGSDDNVNRAANQITGLIYPSLVDAEINQIQNGLLSFRDRVLMQRDTLLRCNQWSPWVRGYGFTGLSQTDDAGSLGYDYEGGGFEMGTGWTDCSGLGVHVFSNLGWSDTDIGVIGQSGTTESYRFGGSLQYVGSSWYAMAAGGAGTRQHQSSRRLDALTAGTFAEGDFGGDDQFGLAEIGLAARTDDQVWLAFLSIQSIHVQTDEFVETGNADFRLAVDEIDAESLRSTVGFSLAQSGNTPLGVATTQLRLGWLREYLDQSQTVDAAIQTGADDQAFRTRSADLGSDWVSMGVQLDWMTLLGGQFTSAYQGNFNTQASLHSGTAGLRWLW